MKVLKITILIQLIITGVSIMAITGACAPTKFNNTQFSKTTMPVQSISQSTIGGATVMNKMSAKELIEMYWKFFFEKAEKTPDESLPQQQLQISELLDSQNNGLKASWLGHSSILINIGGYLILTDPVFQRKVSPIGPTRFNKELPLNVRDLPTIDVVVISHDHYDHLNKFSVQQLSDKAAIFVVPLGVGKRLEKWGIPEEKIVELNWWDEYSPQNDLKIVATPAQHFSGRGLFDRNNTLWASWVIQTPDHRIFFSGDSGYFDGFKEIGKKLGPFDVTFLECGAYNKQWSKVHMFPEQTVQAFFDLGGKVLQPIHLATFNLALHSWYEPMERLTNEAGRKKAIVSTPIMGQVVNYEEPTSVNHWWMPAMKRSRTKNVQPEIVAELRQ
jgi:L-ascorbate metabolism protein UlaG (beta-lactamase superfamily)